MPRGALSIVIDGTTHYDAWNEWGVALSDGAISTLLAPPAAKQRVSNASRLEDGKRTDVSAPVRYEARDLTIEMHLIAPDFETFTARYQSFFNTIAKAKKIYLQFYIYDQWIKFNLKYLSCTQFGVYKGELGKFAVRFEESVPQMGNGTM